MFPSPRAIPAFAAILVGVASPAVARAQTAAERSAIAQGLYETAAELLRTGRFAEACPKLEESQRLDPAMGTQFFLATCYEKAGRPTSAWWLFLEVATAAKAAHQAVRESTARARAAALEPQLPRLSVVATSSVPGLLVALDGVELKPVVWGTAVPVDLGPHVVRATAPGKAPWEATVRVEALGQRLDVKVPVLVDAAGERGPRAASRALPAQRIAALATGGVGLAGLVVGGVLGVMARSAWRQADAACPTHTACSADAHDRSTRSLALATGSTAAFVIGGAGAAGALALWLTAPAPKRAARIRIAPFAGAGGVGIAGVF